MDETTMTVILIALSIHHDTATSSNPIFQDFQHTNDQFYSAVLYTNTYRHNTRRFRNHRSQEVSSGLWPGLLFAGLQFPTVQRRLVPEHGHPLVVQLVQVPAQEEHAHRHHRHQRVVDDRDRHPVISPGSDSGGGNKRGVHCQSLPRVTHIHEGHWPGKVYVLPMTLGPGAAPRL